MAAVSLTVARFFFLWLQVNVPSGQDPASWSHPIPSLLTPPPLPPALLVIRDNSSAQKCHRGILTPRPAASSSPRGVIKFLSAVNLLTCVFFCYFFCACYFYSPGCHRRPVPSLTSTRRETPWRICVVSYQCCVQTIAAPISPALWRRLTYFVTSDWTCCTRKPPPLLFSWWRRALSVKRWYFSSPHGDST